MLLILTLHLAFSDDEFKGLYDISKDEGVMKPSEYADFFVERVTQVITQAWQKPETWRNELGARTRCHRPESARTLF